jgi:hypothetical protein
MKETNCPYCGHKMSINTLNLSSQDIICEYCGMSIKDFVEEKIRTGQFGQEMGSYPQAQQYQQPIIPNNPNISQPPVHSPNVSPISPISPVQLPKAQQIVPSSATKGEALLIMPQINQFLRIAPKTLLFHFGRNSVLSLIKPGHNVDLEWLNSISRIKRDKYNQVIRDHFNITRTKIGQYYIEDAGSSWGTWINGNQIKGKGRTRLRDGDKIELMMSKPGIKTVYPFVMEFKC